jgi:hypothetical protein
VCHMPDQCTSGSGSCSCPTCLWILSAQSRSFHTQSQSWSCESAHLYMVLHQCIPVIWHPGCSANGCSPHLRSKTGTGPVPGTGTHLQQAYSAWPSRKWLFPTLVLRKWDGSCAYNLHID